MLRYSSTNADEFLNIQNGLFLLLQQLKKNYPEWIQILNFIPILNQNNMSGGNALILHLLGAH